MFFGIFLFHLNLTGVPHPCSTASVAVLTVKKGDSFPYCVMQTLQGSIRLHKIKELFCFFTQIFQWGKSKMLKNKLEESCPCKK